MSDLRYPFWVVHTRLLTATNPPREVNIDLNPEEGDQGPQRQILGELVRNAFFCATDPDPATAAPYPASIGLDIEAPASSGRHPDPPLPSAFFIFADISIRRAGRYRLGFQLMKIVAEALFKGATIPVLASVISEVFVVVNAKDFDQVQPSTPLVRGLIAQGAGFPLKLKKGHRESAKTSKAKPAQVEQAKVAQTDRDAPEDDSEDEEDDEPED